MPHDRLPSEMPHDLFDFETETWNVVPKDSESTIIHRLIERGLRAERGKRVNRG
jgi:hypothetical protein